MLERLKGHPLAGLVSAVVLAAAGVALAGGPRGVAPRTGIERELLAAAGGLLALLAVGGIIRWVIARRGTEHAVLRHLAPLRIARRSAGRLGPLVGPLLGMAEELLFRGGLLVLLAPLLGPAGAVATTAALFAVAHLGPAGKNEVGPAFLRGLVLGGCVLAASPAAAVAARGAHELWRSVHIGWILPADWVGGLDLPHDPRPPADPG